MSYQQTYIPGGLGATHGVLDDLLMVMKANNSTDEAQTLIADTASKAAQTFVRTPEGKETLAKVGVAYALPAVLLGVVVGYMLGKRR